MTVNTKFFDLLTMEKEYDNIHKLFTVIKETFTDKGVFVEYY